MSVSLDPLSYIPFDNKNLIFKELEKKVIKLGKETTRVLFLF